MKSKIFLCVIFASLTKQCVYRPTVLDFKRLVTGETFEYPNKWPLPTVTLKNAEEEAIMLIGGKQLGKKIQFL